MPFNESKRSPLRYFLVVFLILVLFAFTFFQYLRSSNIKTLKVNIAELIKLKEDYATIDSCIYILYQAENNSRLYAVTANKAYINKFSLQIHRVSDFLSEFNNRVEGRATDGNFKELVAQKERQTENYLKLRKLTDSLSVGFLKLGLLEREEPVISFPKLARPPSVVVKLDTIRRKTKPAKKFFGRLADAFSAKKGNDSAITVVKTETRNEGVKDVSAELKRYNDRQLKGIRDYYRSLYDNSSKLKAEEKAILVTNNKLISEIISLLQLYKQDEKQYIAKNKAILGGHLQDELKALDGIAIINSVLLFSLIGVILYNIIKLFRHEETLVRLNKRASQEAHAKSRFLANMSHEIRTPLNSIVGFSEQLSVSNLNDTQGEQVTAIQSSSKMLLDIVNEILDFTKFEVGKINFEHIPFTPKDEIEEVFNSMNVLATNKNITLINKINVDAGIILMGDRFRLKQVIMNLLTNAIKFTAEGGQVSLKARLIADTQTKELLKVQVEDTGIGMSKEDLKVIFDEFSQVYSPSRIKQEGTGLGLAICKKIVEMQGGKIGVSSAVSKGSVFSFEIPYEVVEKKAPVLKAVINQVSEPKLEGKKVLLVDDNRMNVLLAQTILKKWNMEFDSAYDGRQALELFKRNHYDLVLTDIQMPVMGGVELTHEIRYNGDSSRSGVPILGITAHVLKENRDIYLKAGMNDLVLKPFLEKQLIDQISRYI